MENKQKTALLRQITELYAKANGVQKIDWNLSYFQQPSIIISCIGDIAELAKIQRGSNGWSRAQTLYERIKKIYYFANTNGTEIRK